MWTQQQDRRLGRFLFWAALAAVFLIPRVLFGPSIEVWARRHGYNQWPFSHEGPMAETLITSVNFLSNDLVVGFIAGGFVAMIWGLFRSRSRANPGRAFRQTKIEAEPHSILSVDKQQQLTSALRKLAKPGSNADILVFPPHQFPLGETLESLFQAANWRTNFTRTPHEFHTQGGYVSGIGVWGYNKKVVEGVARALGAAGLPMVTVTLGALHDLPDDKHRRRIDYVKITIGELDQPLTT